MFIEVPIGVFSLLLSNRTFFLHRRIVLEDICKIFEILVQVNPSFRNLCRSESMSLSSFIL